MIASIFKVENIKIYLIVLGIGAFIWFWKDYSYQKIENARVSENARQLRKADSLKFAQVSLNKKEIIEELNYNNKELLKRIEQADIKINRIQRIVSQKQTYYDTIKVTTELKGLAKSVLEGTPISFPVVDSTECWLMKGVIDFNGEELSFDVVERRFKNVTDIITFWERNQWSFLGLKTRLFGKKQITVKVFNTCGQTETFVIENKNLLKK